MMLMTIRTVQYQSLLSLSVLVCVNVPLRATNWCFSAGRPMSCGLRPNPSSAPLPLFVRLGKSTSNEVNVLCLNSEHASILRILVGEGRVRLMGICAETSSVRLADAGVEHPTIYPI